MDSLSNNASPEAQVVSAILKEKLVYAVEALYDALTCTWSDNGNIMAEAVKDHVVGKLARITGTSEEAVLEVVARRVEEAQ